jgi:hypothetical protein
MFKQNTQTVISLKTELESVTTLEEGYELIWNKLTPKQRAWVNSACYREVYSETLWREIYTNSFRLVDEINSRSINGDKIILPRETGFASNPIAGRGTTTSYEMLCDPKVLYALHYKADKSKAYCLVLSLLLIKELPAKLIPQLDTWGVISESFQGSYSNLLWTHLNEGDQALPLLLDSALDARGLHQWDIRLELYLGCLQQEKFNPLVRAKISTKIKRNFEAINLSQSYSETDIHKKLIAGVKKIYNVPDDIPDSWVEELVR